MFGLACPSVWALDPNSHISQYSHSVWRTQEGFFGGAPNALTQTADGYIWIGTQNGLLRFDGARFVPFQTATGERLSIPSIFALLGSKDGSLWIGTGSYLARWKDNKLTDYRKTLGRINAILEDRNHEIWIARSRTRDDAGPLCKVVENDLRCYGQNAGIFFKNAGTLAQDVSEDWWIASASYVAHGKENSFAVYAPDALKSADGLDGFTALAASVNGSIWAGVDRSGPGLGLQYVKNGKWRTFRTSQVDGSHIPVMALLFDRDRSLWVGTTNQGLYRISGEKVDHFGAANGLSSDSITGFYEDHEDNIWVTTAKGLDKFRTLPVLTFSTGEGLSADLANSVLATRDGTVLAGNHDALESIRNGVVTSLHTVQSGRSTTSLLEDRTKALWMGIDNNLFVRSRNRFAQVNTPGGKPTGIVRSLTEDADGNIWATPIKDSGKIFRISRSRTVEEVLLPAKRRVLATAARPSSGIWAGFQDGDLGEYADGKWRILPSRRTAGSAPVTAVASTPDGGVLGATPAGLVGWRDGKQHSLSADNGLPCNWVYSLVFDTKKTLWLYTVCGLVGIADLELQRWWHRPESKVKTLMLDVLDGVQAARADFAPGASLSPDGKLWFANSNALQEFDPSHIRKNAVVPPVYIEEIIADRKGYPTQHELRMPPLTREVEIHYTALSFVVPQRVKFRYMLEGWDNEWQEAGTRRQAFYTNLSPKAYRFRVMACNDDGLWNTAGAALSFTIAPAYYQTTWFYFLCMAGFAVALVLLYLLRLKQATEQIQQRLSARVEERERIARELHDTLLQGFQGLVLRFQAIMKKLPETGPAREMMEQVLDRADGVLLEGRQSVRDLREKGTSLDELPLALKECGEDLARDHSALFTLTVLGAPRELNRIVLNESDRIAREAITNAFLHSGASKIEVELTYATNRLSIRIRDNGTGIDQRIIDTGKAGHWGLSGMRERSQKIGAQLYIWSYPAAGTEVELTVRDDVAYPKSDKKTLWRFLKRRAGVVAGVQDRG